MHGGPVRLTERGLHLVDAGVGDGDDVAHADTEEAFVGEEESDDLGFEQGQFDLVSDLLDIDEAHLAAFCLLIEAAHELEALLSLGVQCESHPGVLPRTG